MMGATLDRRRVTTCVVCVLLASCSIDSSYENTSFQCQLSEVCPPGYHCVDGVCQAGVLDAGIDDAAVPAPVDATPNAPDAPTRDAATPQPPDAAAGPITTTFGERDDADHRDVTADTYLDTDYPRENFGTEPVIKVDAHYLEVGLLRFDVSAIPPTAEIASAELALTVIEPLEGGTFELNPLLRPWDELEADVYDRLDGVPWASTAAGSASIDPNLAGIAPAPISVGPLTIPIEPGVVQRWVQDESSNNGLRLECVSVDGHGVNFRSRHASNASTRPLLRVTYSP